MRDTQLQHLTTRQKFLAMYVAHRSWMEKIRRRIERREQIPQDIDGAARKDLFAHGVLDSSKEKGTPVLIIASAEMMAMFKDPAMIEEAKTQAPPSGRQMKEIDGITDEVTQVIPNSKLRGLLRDSTPPPPRSKRGTKRDGASPVAADETVMDVSQLT